MNSATNKVILPIWVTFPFHELATFFTSKITFQNSRCGYVSEFAKLLSHQWLELIRIVTWTLLNYPPSGIAQYLKNTLDLGRKFDWDFRRNFRNNGYNATEHAQNDTYIYIMATEEDRKFQKQIWDRVWSAMPLISRCLVWLIVAGCSKTVANYYLRPEM
jgi:hypothetical protein